MYFYVPGMNNPKRQSKETISFIKPSKRIKYLEINLIMEVQDLHATKLQNILERNKSRPK